MGAFGARWAAAPPPGHPDGRLRREPEQLIGEVRRPLPVAPGCPERFHYEYSRNGVANLFMTLEPLTGTCQVKVSERRTMREWAHTVRELVDVHYPEAETINRRRAHQAQATLSSITDRVNH